MNQTGRPTLLILRALGLGDILTGLPAMRALTDAFPTHHKIIAAPLRFAPLLIREGAADEVVDHHDLAPLDPALTGPDVAVDLHGRGPGSQPLLLALRPRRLIAFAHPDLPDTASGPRWRPGEHEVQHWCRLLAESGIPSDPQRLQIQPPAGPPPPRAVGATVIHPGAASGARRWPPERFAAIARSEANPGRPVVITGTSDERPLAEIVATAAGLDPSCVLAGTDLDELIRIVAAAGAVVCGDTGVAHLATALGTPSVVLFGPTPPSEWGPPPDRPHHIALWAGRRGDPHAASVDAGLLTITVAEVNNALARLPARAAPEPMLAGNPG
jgi:ADP-heptose:LPS heptosyltransferase